MACKEPQFIDDKIIEAMKDTIPNGRCSESQPQPTNSSTTFANIITSTVYENNNVCEQS